MEYLAKIIHEQRTEDKLFWKYTFVDFETKREDYFLNDYQINYLPSLAGRLKLLEDNNNQHSKTFQWFNQEIFSASKEFERLETLIKLERDWDKGIRKVENNFSKKKKLTSREIELLREKGFSWQEIQDFCGVSEWTIRRWKKEEPNRPKQKRGRKKKITRNNLSLLYSYITKKNTSTQQEMANHLFQQVGVKMSQSTISRTLKREKITYKKATVSYSEKKSRIEEIREFTKFLEFPLFPCNRILAVDECSFHLNEAPRYAYSRKGLRASTWKPGNKGSNYTLILCIQNITGKGVVHYQLIEDGAKAENFHKFLTEISLPIDKQFYLLLDNARIHHAKQACRELGLSTIKELLTQKNIQPKYLPAYTPELNPVELCFNFIRQYVEKCQPRTVVELKKSIDEVMNIINQKDLTDFFWHCFNFTFC